MAALCSGVQYGLASKENFSGNKDLIFVKLTDSALRAIEDYIKNLNKFSSNQNATIKFLGNEGELSFPSLQNGYASFNFSLSNTSDMEGPGGSFECMQQLSSPRGSLESIGAVPHKMRIHANDDVYAATKQRMTVVEEIHKNKCAREIKPNQPDIGRKVKVKQSSNRSAIVPPSRREVPLPRDIPAKPSYQPTIPPKPSIAPSNTYTNGLGNQHAVNPRVQNKPSMPDIARRPVKERLIHLLALRPFKKPELYERLSREGLKEKKNLASILKQISCLKDNAYHLNRVLWNDVREDWPFYTESEKQILKRRKPQNLTPPGGSDGGSSGSGHSPNSTHPGSPPPVSSKRPGYFDGADGLPTKRPRISHYRKPSEPLYRSPAENISQRRPVTDSRDASNMNPRSRERELVDYSSLTTNDFVNGGFNDKHNLSEDEDVVAGKKRSSDNHNLSVNVNREKTLTETSNYLSPCKEVFPKEDTLRNNYEMLDNEKIRQNEITKIHQNDVPSNNSRTQHKESNKRKQETREQTRWSNATTYPLENNSNENIRRIFNNENDRSLLNGSVESSYHPDYLTEYTTIKDSNQRKRYKECFNKYFQEYKQLFAAIEKISKYFVLLEQKLKNADSESPGYLDIQKQIVRAYQDSKKNPKHIEVNNRFKYLHDKLSHIKRLVSEYDENEDIEH